MLSINNPSTVNEDIGIKNNLDLDGSLNVDKTMQKPELVAGIYRGFPSIPGVVKAVFNGPGVRVNNIIDHPKEFREDVMHVGTFNDEKMAVMYAGICAKFGASYALQEIIGFDANEREITVPNYSVYLEPDPNAKMEIVKVFQDSKNNIVRFTGNLSKMGGKVGEVMQEAWKHGAVFATTIALALFEIGKRAMEGGGLVQGEGKTGSSSLT